MCRTSIFSHDVKILPQYIIRRSFLHIRHLLYSFCHSTCFQHTETEFLDKSRTLIESLLHTKRIFGQQLSGYWGIENYQSFSITTRIFGSFCSTKWGVYCRRCYATWRVVVRIDFHTPVCSFSLEKWGCDWSFLDSGWIHKPHGVINI